MDIAIRWPLPQICQGNMLSAVLQVPDTSYETARNELSQLRMQLKKAQAAARPNNGRMIQVSLHLKSELKCYLVVSCMHFGFTQDLAA